MRVMPYEDTLADFEDDFLLPPLPDDVQEDFRRNYIITSSNPHIAIWQMEGMGIPTEKAQLIYIRNWLDSEGNPLTDNHSPFAVTRSHYNLGYPVSFITDQQMMRCIGSVDNVPRILQPVRRLIVGHEIGHHKAILVLAQLMGLGGMPAEKANYMLNDDAPEEGVDIAAQRITEVFCDGFGGLRTLRDEPESAIHALNWSRKSRMMALWTDLENNAEKRTRDLPHDVTQYAIHQVNAGLIEHADELTKKVRGATDDDLVEMAFEGTRVMYPIIAAEADMLENTARRHMQSARGRDRMRRALAASRKYEEHELYSDALQPHEVLEGSIDTLRRSDKRRATVANALEFPFKTK